MSVNNRSIVRVQVFSMLFLVLVFSGPFVSTLFSERYSGLYFVKDLYFVVKTDDGEVLGSANVYLFVMTSRGWELIGSTYTSSIGVALFRPALPLVSAGVFELNGSKLRVYKSVNLMVVVVKKPYIGLYTFAVDPTSELGFPETVFVKAYRLLENEGRAASSSGIGVRYTTSWENVLNEWQEYTTVLRYSTYYGIKAKWNYPIGSKVRVQTKWRWPPGSSSPWQDGGYVDINVDIGTASDWRTGPYIRTLQFKLNYTHSIISLGAVAIEEIYAKDTPYDPVATRELVSSWNNVPVSGPIHVDVQQETTRTIDVSGGEDYDFNVQVTLSYPWTISIGLGVDKNPSPIATLTIYADEWSPGYVARIVSLRDTDFLDTRTFWYKP